MARNKVVAKVRFDDGSKVVNSKAMDYEPGEEYQGKGDCLKQAKEKGLVCSDVEFADYQKVVVSGSDKIDELNQIVKDQAEALEKAEAKIADLQSQLSELDIIDDEIEGAE